MMKYKVTIFCYYLALFLVIGMNKISTIVFPMVLFAKIKTIIKQDFPTISCHSNCRNWATSSRDTTFVVLIKL